MSFYSYVVIGITVTLQTLDGFSDVHNLYNTFYETNDPILCIPLL